MTSSEYGSSTTGHHDGITGSGYKSGVDPLDSDLTGKQSGTGYDSTSSGYGQSTGTTGTGPHSSGLANKADPRIDSDRG